MEMNGGGSCTFQVWMRVVWVGTLRADTVSVCVCLTLHLSILLHNWPNENMLQIVFPLWPVVMNRRFSEAELWGFVPFFLSSSHPCSALESPPCIDDLFHTLPVIIAVTGAAIPLFRNKDFEMENCRRQRTLRRKEKVNVAISITIETLFIWKAGCPNQFDCIYTIQNQPPQCKLNLQ